MQLKRSNDALHRPGAFKKVRCARGSAGAFGGIESAVWQVTRLGRSRRTRVVRAHPRERFSSELTLTPAQVAAFAQSAGDDNPMHHDPVFAAGTRYGRLVASGTQTSALLMGLTASHFSTRGAMVGLEFWFRFRRPVYADETIHLEWLVVRVRLHARLRGEIVDLRGRIRGPDGQTAVGARGRVLVADKL